MEYNTGRGSLQMKEYGRHVKKMVEYVLTVEDKEQRQRNAEAIVELMGFLNPHLKQVEDYKHKLWDHLFVISDFKLDVESPYGGKPTPEEYHAKPDPLPYPKSRLKYNHLGKNLERLIDKAMVETDPEKKSGFAHTIAHYMKLAYSTWHKELVHDDGIRQELDAITKGELTFTNTPFVRHRPAPFRDEERTGPAVVAVATTATMVAVAATATTMAAAVAATIAASSFPKNATKPNRFTSIHSPIVNAIGLFFLGQLAAVQVSAIVGAITCSGLRASGQLPVLSPCPWAAVQVATPA
jgi:Domain of unknown function (DUF4290)